MNKYAESLAECVKSCGICGHEFSDDDMYSWYCEKCENSLVCECGAPSDDIVIEWHVDVTTKEYTFFYIDIECSCGRRLEKSTGPDCNIDLASRNVYLEWMDSKASFACARIKQHEEEMR